MNDLTYSAQLRALADFFEAHPDLPKPGLPYLAYTGLEGMAAAARIAAGLPGAYKSYDDKWASVYLPVPGLRWYNSLQVYTARNTICEPVETEVVEVPARLETKVTKWKCQPLLGLEAALSPLEQGGTNK
jgi:hypothetical protein